MWVRSRGTPGGIDGWFTDRSRAGGGAVIDLGVHAIDAAWYLMGNPKPRTVSAQTYQKFPQLVKTAVFDVEDSACGMIRFENGASVLFEVSWAANLTDDIPLGKWGTARIIQYHRCTDRKDRSGSWIRCSCIRRSKSRLCPCLRIRMENWSIVSCLLNLSRTNLFPKCKIFCGQSGAKKLRSIVRSRRYAHGNVGCDLSVQLNRQGSQPEVRQGMRPWEYMLG